MMNRRIYIAVIILAAGILTTTYYSRRETVPVHAPLSALPYRISEWDGTREHLQPEVIQKLGTTEVLMRSYSAGGDTAVRGFPVFLYIGYYQSQRQGQTYHSPKNCLIGSGWQIARTERVPVNLGSGKVMINRLLIQKGLKKELVLYWYQDRGRTIASEYMAKAYMVVDALTMNRTDGAMVRVSSPLIGDEEQVFTVLVDFIKDLAPLLDRHLPGPGNKEA